MFDVGYSSAPSTSGRHFLKGCECEKTFYLINSVVIPRDYARSYRRAKCGEVLRSIRPLGLQLPGSVTKPDVKPLGRNTRIVVHINKFDTRHKSLGVYYFHSGSDK